MSNKHKKRILCLTSNFPRWVDDSTTPFVLNLAKDLQELGWHIDVLAPHAPGCEKNECLQGVHVERFQYFWPESAQSICYQGGALINLRKQKSNYFKAPVFVTVELAALAKKLASGRYDLVHSHWLLPQGFVGVWAGHLARVPHVTTIHGGDVFGLRKKIFLPFKNFALKHVDAVTVNSSATEAAARSLCPTLQCIHRIPMGVKTPNISKDDEEVISIRKRYLAGDGPLIVFVGRIVDEKGVEDLIRALSFITQKCPDVRALIIGEGQDRNAMEDLAKVLGLADRITFTGWVNPDYVPYYLAAGDVFAGPSRFKEGWVEAQGLTFLEAMAVGTPVIATRCGGIVDSVKHEKTGILVDQRSPDQIASAILRIKTDPNLAVVMQKHSWSRVRKHFSRKVSAAHFSRLFTSLLSATKTF